MRATRPAWRDLTPEAKLRATARAIANRAQSRGKLVPQPCVVCAAPGAQKHHHDYRRPLDVYWLCQRHHDALHARKRARARYGATYPT